MSKYRADPRFLNNCRAIPSLLTSRFRAFTFSSLSYFINLAWFLTRRREGKSTAGGPPDKPNRQFPSDMALLEDDTMKNIVLMFSMSEASFFHCFKGAYLKLVNSGESF